MKASEVTDYIERAMEFLVKACANLNSNNTVTVIYKNGDGVNHYYDIKINLLAVAVHESTFRYTNDYGEIIITPHNTGEKACIFISNCSFESD